MSEPAKVPNFLKAMTYEDQPIASYNWIGGLHPFITISRQTGAGGHCLADCLLEKMGGLQRIPLFNNWHILDQKICQSIIDEMRLRVSASALLTEEYRSELEDLMHQLFSGGTPQSRVVMEVFRLLRYEASWGKVIIVGRAGCSLTRHLPQGVHVRLVAPLEVRVKRMMDMLDLSHKQAGQLVADRDRARARLMKDCFNQSIEDPLLYSMVWNTHTVPMDIIANTILRFTESHALKIAAGR